MALVTKNAIQDWHRYMVQTVKATPGMENIFEEPARVLNFDETAFPFNAATGRAEKVFAATGSRSVNAREPGTKETMTVGLTISGDGHFYPPYIICTGSSKKKFPSPDNMAMEAFPDAAYTQNEKGWETQETFKMYVQQLHLWLLQRRVPGPWLLFVDGSSTHLGLEAIEYAAANNIHIMILLAHATHILQPLDLCVCGPLKTHYNEQVQNHFATTGSFVKKYNFPIVLKKAFDKINRPNIAKEGFKKAGIIPPIFDNIPLQRVALADSEDAPPTTTSPNPSPVIITATPAPSQPLQHTQFMIQITPTGQIQMTPMNRKPTKYNGRPRSIEVRFPFVIDTLGNNFAGNLEEISPNAILHARCLDLHPGVP